MSAGLPVLRDRTHLDRATVTGCGDPRGQLDRGVEILGLEDEAPADRSVGIDERVVRR
jgi:hypothetical protein